MKTQYPVIDIDPTFSRVLRYMRPVDYATVVGTTAAFPTLLWAWERIDFSGATAKQLRSGLRISTLLGFSAGFLLAYQNVAKRFWGWSENAAEVARDHAELSARVAKGLPVYGESDIPPNIQHIAAGNSTWAPLNFAVIPWFNLVNHPYHGVDTSKYGEPPKKQPEA